ncbi:hypothetical protein P691DRAFT_801957 [Macrolepiota fuliginosa MF-IS2]|uniref:Zn(2)-C6 fungal-type domain-containing protein n=1 Tax=Macrolepiota fuliginosa MF-IS2 TaxID=1400762 RepID=A0A9P6C9E6_9AGAR|nr:hypothetical protein P691DRAFT_801957 [Macrolepiota fuliginosa MF-IS2]
MADSQQRPLKRQRKAADTSHDISQPLTPPQQIQPPQPVDHIFIADGLLNKKPGGKKAPLSCCECRRLKLKCDRNFPCASCKKRGCAEICPDGVLVSGKGTRFILANTEQLHAKIQEMSDRIRNLEDAVQKTDPDSSLLASGLLSIKSTMGLYSSNGGPNPQERDDGKKVSRVTPDDTQRVAGTSRAESGSVDDTAMQVDGPSCIVKTENSITFDLTSIQSDIHRLNYSFPLPSKVQSNPERNIAMREHIRSQLPPRKEAQRLWDQARRNALWQYNPHPSTTFFPNLLHHIYSSSSDQQPKPIKEIDPRRLALLLMILAVACIVDVPSPSPRSTPPSQSPPHQPPTTPPISNAIHAALLEAETRASRYHALGRASLCEVPIMEETNVETVLALFYEVWFLAVWSDGKKAVGEAWGIMGLVAKLAQSIGLHRNGGKSKVIHEEVETRRALFWELLYLDARLSLSLGRPPSLSIHHMDCPRPSYIPDDECESGGSLHHFQEWKHACYQQCLVPVLDAISKPGQEYKSILDLDRRIRDFSIPAPLRNKEKLKSRSMVLQRASLGTALEAVLLQLHRSYFIRALSGPEEAFNRRHKYAPSVVAVFLSASRMIATVQELFQREPELTARILWYWSNAFSAAVALCLLVSRAPFTCLSPAALQELERARLLFRAAKEMCPRALQVLPILETMVDKANDIYNRWANGQELPTIVLRHITDDAMSPSTFSGSEDGDMRSSPAIPPEDPFLYTHQSLAQCIAEVHQIARTMFPLRKPCSCSSKAAVVNGSGKGNGKKVGNGVVAGGGLVSGAGHGHELGPKHVVGAGVGASANECPPSHEWSPPPVVNASSPVLPDAPPVGFGGSGTGVAVGYPVYGSAGVGGGAYSSLKGSGMSPSPSSSVYGGRVASPTGVNGAGYSGYAGANGGGYAGHVNGGTRSPTYSGTPSATSATPPLATNGAPRISPSGSGADTGGLYGSMAVLPASAPPVSFPPTTSKLAMVDTINFELGALNASSDQSFMVFY